MIDNKKAISFRFDNAIMTDNKPEKVTKSIVHDKLICNGRRGRKGNWYYVLGEWSCLDCDRNWTSKKTKILLSKYKDDVDADNLQRNERINQQCMNCGSKNTKLLTYKPIDIKPPPPPVHDNLIFKYKGDEWYRVFGNWKCERQDCNKGWASAHTYILLSRYLDRVQATDLERGVDYWGQDCTNTLVGQSEGKLINYRHLGSGQSSYSLEPNHKSIHCYKCRANFPCIT